MGLEWFHYVLIVLGAILLLPFLGLFCVNAGCLKLCGFGQEDTPTSVYETKPGGGREQEESNNNNNNQRQTKNNNNRKNRRQSHPDNGHDNDYDNAERGQRRSRSNSNGHGRQQRGRTPDWVS